MAKKPHPRYERFCESARNDYAADLIYRREAWVYRRLWGYWATPDMMRSLNKALAKHFGVPEPRLVLRLSKRDRTGGWFHVGKRLEHHIFVRGVREGGLGITRGLTNRCKHRAIKGWAAAGEYHVSTLLHEWAHYLCFLWWTHGAHDSRFATLTEITHEWYSRRRKREILRKTWIGGDE